MNRHVASLLAAALVGGGMTGVAPAAPRAPVPEVLKTAESSAEDIVDYALSRDRAGARATAADLGATTTGATTAALTRAGVPRPQLAQLRLRSQRVVVTARNGSFVEIALAANAVSQLMAGLYARFEDHVPAGILTLDYLDREAQLRSAAGETSRAALAVKALQPAWLAVRPKVVAAGGADAAAAYGRHVAAMKRLDPTSRARLKAEAARGLELVDELENVFTTS